MSHPTARGLKLAGMKPAPASFTPSSASGAAQMIGLFLARLWAALLRLEASQAAIAPAEAASMVHAGEAMVHAFIRGLAATELQAAGFPDAAKALRRACADGAGATSPTHMDPVSPAELTRRLEASLLMFERAEALAHQLACMMVCALGLTFSQSRGAQGDNLVSLAEQAALSAVYVKLSFTRAKQRYPIPPTPIPVGQGPPDCSPPIPNLIWDPCRSAGKMPGDTSLA